MNLHDERRFRAGRVGYRPDLARGAYQISSRDARCRVVCINRVYIRVSLT